jgi:phage tail tube protein FII
MGAEIQSNVSESEYTSALGVTLTLTYSFKQEDKGSWNKAEDKTYSFPIILSVLKSVTNQHNNQMNRHHPIIL